MDLTHLGPYKLGPRLGRGGMGTVYAATELATGEPAAIKVLSPNLAGEEGFRERFQAEIETLKKLRHPQIVRLFGWGEQDGHLFYAMELVPGTNLEEELRQGRRFTWREASEIGIKLARALKHAHDHGVIHRDLKPANVMLTPEGDVKLSDFGIARLFGNVGLTVDGGVIGTAEYMSPEQAEGRPVSERSDLYGLGGTLYALLAGRPPFRAKSLPEMLQLQRYAAPEPVRRWAADVPSELDEIVLELLEKNPEQRIPSAMVLGRRLEATVRGLSLREAGHAPDEPGQGDTVANTDFIVAPEAGPPPQAAADDLEATRAAPPTATSEAATLPDRAGGWVSPAHPPGARTPAPPSPEYSVAAAAAPEAPTMAPPESPRGSAGRRDSAARSAPDRGSEPTDDWSPALAPTGARFITLAESEAEAAEAEATPLAIRILQVGLLVSALLGVVAVGWYLAQPPSADELYARVIHAQEDHGLEGLLETQADLDRFLKLYPGDARRAELAGLRSDLETYRRTRNFERRLERLAQQGELTPWERAFVEANRLAESDPEPALERLSALVTLYGPEAENSREASNLLQLARQRIEVLRKDLVRRQAEDQAALHVQLRRAEEVFPHDPSLARGIWQAIVTLYADRAWAAEAVAQARQSLETTAAATVGQGSP